MLELGCPTMTKPLRFDAFDGWTLTPYASAILDLYDLPHYQLHETLKTNLTGTALEVTDSRTHMFEHDALILGATCLIGNVDTGDQGQQILLNVTHDYTGITWNASNPLDAAPATAYAAVPAQGLPIVALPEAFFLPAHTRLYHRWRNCFAPGVTGGSISWVGLLLPYPKFKPEQRPPTVCIDGQNIRIGSRVPWFATMGLGDQISSLGNPLWTLRGTGGLNDYQVYNYTQPHFRDVEIHGMNANFFQKAGVSTTPANILLRIADFGEGPMWQPKQCTVLELMGDLTKAYPVMPFTNPYLLRAGHQLEIRTSNLTGATITNAYATVIGTQICN